MANEAIYFPKDDNTAFVYSCPPFLTQGQAKLLGNF